MEIFIISWHWKFWLNKHEYCNKYWKNGVEIKLIYSKYWKNGTWIEFTKESEAQAWDIIAVPAGK